MNRVPLRLRFIRFPDIFTPQRSITWQRSNDSVARWDRVASETGQVYEPVLGLEIHTQIQSQRKLFSGSLTQFDAEPNTQVSLFDAGHPGTLPVLNPECVRKAVLLILGLKGSVQLNSSFERKHYFYPDLPQGYQITQHNSPIGRGGQLILGKTDQLPYEHTVRIEQIQIEQDTATLLDIPNGTGVNLNRAGAGLLEVVTYPDISNSSEASSFLLKLQSLLRCLGVSDGNMEQGSLRCDVNVSLRKPGEPFGTRCELKNLHTPRFVAAAVDAEVERQIEILETGGSVVQETRGYDPITKKTILLRSKETAPDYRYMPEPDVPSLYLQNNQIDALHKNLPELPDATYERWLNNYQMKPADALVLLREPGAPAYFDAIVRLGHPPSLVTSWITSILFGILSKRKIAFANLSVSKEQFSSILQSITSHTISGKTGKVLLDRMVQGDSRLASEIIESESLAMMSDISTLTPIISKLVQENPSRAAQVLAGNSRADSWFKGQVMQKTQGRADPTAIQTILLDLVKKL